VTVRAGGSVKGAGGDVALVAGTGGVQGGSVVLSGGAASAQGGSVVLQAGAGSLSGTVRVLDAQGGVHFEVDQHGQVDMASSPGQELHLQSGGSINIASGPGAETDFLSADSVSLGQVNMRIRSDKVYTHVPLHTVEVLQASDKRIKEDIEPIDYDEVTHRLMKLTVKSYKYTKQWQQIRGADDTRVRGVIAQEINEVFPEYITVNPVMAFPEKNFSITNFLDLTRLSSQLTFWRLSRLT